MRISREKLESLRSYSMGKEPLSFDPGADSEFREKVHRAVQHLNLIPPYSQRVAHSLSGYTITPNPSGRENGEIDFFGRVVYLPPGVSPTIMAAILVHEGVGHARRVAEDVAFYRETLEAVGVDPNEGPLEPLCNTLAREAADSEGDLDANVHTAQFLNIAGYSPQELEGNLYSIISRLTLPSAVAAAAKRNFLMREGLGLQQIKV